MYAPRWLDTTTSSPASYYPNHTTYPSAPTTSSSSSNLSLPLSVSTNASSVASASMSQAHGLRDDSCNAQLGFGFNRSLDLNPILPPPRLSIAVLPQFSSTRSWPEQTPVGGFQHGQQHGQQHRSQAGEHFNNRCEIESNRVPAELRKNPRRTSNSTTSRGCPPTLTRQAERKGEFVDKLVDSAALIIETIWPLSSVACREEHGAQSSTLSLRVFIQETLRRSRTSYSTLQVGLYYLILIKPHVPSIDFTMEQTPESNAKRPLMCGRRMFLAALILSSKWLQDRNYSSKAWSRISGLKVDEINENEMTFLCAVGWELHVTAETYNVWNNLVMKYTPPFPPPPSPGSSMPGHDSWVRERDEFKLLIQSLNPALDNVDDFHWVSPKERELRTRPNTRAHPRTNDQRRSELYAPNPVPPPMEPAWTAGGSPVPRFQAPALGLLPTSRGSTPQQSRGSSTPAASVASRLLLPSLADQCAGLAMDRRTSDWRALDNNHGILPRRSSYADSVTLASSPESMVSDHSDRSTAESQSSSTTLASSVYSDSQAPMLVQALSGPVTSKPVWADHDFISKVETPTSPTTPLANESTYTEREAAYALQQLHKYLPKGLKRSCDASEAPVQHTVRQLLAPDVRPRRFPRSNSSGSARSTDRSLVSMILTPPDSIKELFVDEIEEVAPPRAQKRGRYALPVGVNQECAGVYDASDRTTCAGHEDL